MIATSPSTVCCWLRVEPNHPVRHRPGDKPSRPSQAGQDRSSGGALHLDRLGAVRPLLRNRRSCLPRVLRQTHAESSAEHPAMREQSPDRHRGNIDVGGSGAAALSEPGRVGALVRGVRPAAKLLILHTPDRVSKDGAAMAECEVTAEPGGVARPGQRSASRPGPAARINDQLREFCETPGSCPVCPGHGSQKTSQNSRVLRGSSERLRAWS
jgi:hypothetical protein